MKSLAPARLILCILCMLSWPLLAAGGRGEEIPGPLDISDGSIAAWLRFLAAPELEGRESGTRGYDLAALYVAALLEEWGVRPLGDGPPGEGASYFQGFDLVRRSWDVAGASLSVRPEGRREERVALEGRVALAAGEDIDWTEPWVFAGCGRGVLGDSSDDYRGLEVDRRVVLIRPAPEDVDLAIAEAARRGARRVVVASDERVAEGGRTELPELPERILHRLKPYRPEVVFIASSVASLVLEAAGLHSGALGAEPPRPTALPGVQVTLRVPARDAKRKTHNVIGWVEGSDPTLRGEYVAVGAHLDHVGIHDGKVYPGADDDASGSAAVLAVARAAALNPVRPRRSLLFMFFAAEEKGLWGSEHFAVRPPVDLAGMALEIQLDMVGRRSSSEEEPSGSSPKVHAVGMDRHCDELAGWLRSLAEPIGLRVEGGLEEFYARSDHYAFGSRGIPVIFLFTGLHEDYHMPTDTAEKIDFGLVARVARLAYQVSREVADRPERPRRSRV